MTRRSLGPLTVAGLLALAVPVQAPGVPWCVLPALRQAHAHRTAPHRKPGPPREAALPAVLSPLVRWLPAIRREGRAAGVPASLLAAVVMVESQGRPWAVSPEGAVGLAQVMPVTAASVGVRDPWSPSGSLRAGARYLASLAGAYGASATCLRAGPAGDPDCAWRTDEVLSAYNAGPAGGFQGAYVEAVRSWWVQAKAFV